MVMQVTPGYGASVASELKGNAHHQRIIAHYDNLRLQVKPALSVAEYPVGTCVGGEMLFHTALRLAGDSALCTAVQISMVEGTAPADMQLVLYTDPLLLTPQNRQTFVLGAEELHNILGIIPIAASAYAALGTHWLAHAAPLTPLFLQAGVGVTTLRACLIARAAFTPAAVDALTVSVTVQRN